MSKVIYPGSFDPVTLGHVNIVERLSKCFSEVVVLVSSADAKPYVFSLEERQNLLLESLKHLPNVEVSIGRDLTVNEARRRGARIIARGLRAISDFEYEMSIAHMNRHLEPELETLIIFADPRFSFVSSRLLKEIARRGGDISPFVPKPVQKVFKERLLEVP